MSPEALEQLGNDPNKIAERLSAALMKLEGDLVGLNQEALQLFAETNPDDAKALIQLLEADSQDSPEVLMAVGELGTFLRDVAPGKIEERKVAEEKAGQQREKAENDVNYVLERFMVHIDNNANHRSKVDLRNPMVYQIAARIAKENNHPFSALLNAYDSVDAIVTAARSGELDINEFRENYSYVSSGFPFGGTSVSRQGNYLRDLSSFMSDHGREIVAVMKAYDEAVVTPEEKTADAELATSEAQQRAVEQDQALLREIDAVAAKTLNTFTNNVLIYQNTYFAQIAEDVLLNWANNNVTEAGHLNDLLAEIELANESGQSDPELLARLDSFLQKISQFRAQPSSSAQPRTAATRTAPSAPATPSAPRPVATAPARPTAAPSAPREAVSGQTTSSTEWLTNLTQERAGQLLTGSGDVYTFSVSGDDLRHSRIQHFVGPNAKGPLKDVPTEGTTISSEGVDYTWNGQTWGNGPRRLLVKNGTRIEVKRTDVEAPTTVADATTEAAASADESAPEVVAKSPKDLVGEALAKAGLDSAQADTVIKGILDAHLSFDTGSTEPELTSFSLEMHGHLPVVKVDIKAKRANGEEYTEPHVLFMSPIEPAIDPETGVLYYTNEGPKQLFTALIEGGPSASSLFTKEADAISQIEAYETKFDELASTRFEGFSATENEMRGILKEIADVQVKIAENAGKTMRLRYQKGRLKRLLTNKRNQKIRKSYENQYAIMQNIANGLNQLDPERTKRARDAITALELDFSPSFNDSLTALAVASGAKEPIEWVA